MVQVAAARGASVVGIDVAEAKLAAIGDIGIEVAEWGDIAGGGSGKEAPTVVVDLVGTTETTRWAIDHLAMSGRLVCLTTFRDRQVPFESRELVFRELEVLGSRYANTAEVSEAARLVADGSVRPVIGSVAEPESVLDLHDALVGQRLIGRGALDWRET
jgi:D-arabinose 1-dehydrogenase-like Zn-dependent alcohol dehydrogenase